MKRLLITLLAALFVSGAFAQTPFPDIPDNHWAGEAVSEIADLGIVIGFPDGTFRGNEAFTRYQAALVVSRLLDVINEDLDARMALSEEDMASLRNALQELASDVASQGVRLSDVESSVASLSDDVMTGQSRLDELESRLEGVGDTDSDVVRDLLNQLASQRVAVDTAQAQAESAEALANDALDAANAAASRARANEDGVAALNSLVQGLGNRITALEQRPVQDGGAAAPGVPAGLTDRVSRAEADIANIREFVILLRRDQVALRDRVSALEASDAIQSAQLATLDERVTELENNPLGLSGSISVSYQVQRLSGGAFDVDRAYGLNAERDTGASIFSSGTDADANPAGASATAVDAPGERAQDLADITGADQQVDASLSIDSAFGGELLAGDFGVAVDFSFVQVGTPLTDTAGDPIPNPFVFSVSQVLITFDPIGGDPLTFTFGEEVSATLSPYVFGMDEVPGFVLTVGSPDFLAFLDPNLTFAHTSRDDTGDGQLDFFKTGIGLDLSPFEGFTVGVNYAQAAANAEDFNDLQDDNVSTTVYGVDGSLNLSIFDLGFEYATSTVEGATPASESVLYVTLGVDTEGLPILTSLDANYRDIAPDWDGSGGGANYGLVDSNNDFPFVEDQTGFMVNAGLGLFILDLEAYFDSYTTTAPAAAVAAFGVDVSADLFAGFELTGFYHQATVDGTVVDATNSPVDATESAVVAGSVSRGTHYDTGFGVALNHDGESESALISGLNLGVSYSQTEADFSKTTLAANADMAFEVSILTLTPYVSYESVVDADTPSDDTNTIAVGTGLTTEPLGVFFAPSLEAAVNYRTTSHSDAATYVATEMQWSVGLVLNEFLFDNSSLTARYGSWTGTNVAATDVNGEGATDISAGDVNNGLTQTVNGYELAWMYQGLEMGYGVYVADEGDAAGVSAGQAFTISYSVDF